MGLTANARGLYMEDHAVAACRQLKTRNRNTTTIFYHDSANMWTNDQPAGFGRIGQQPRFWNPTVLRADDDVVAHHPEWLLRNSSGGFVFDHYANNHVLDHSCDAAQRRWVEVCVNATRSGAVDGCFADFPNVGVHDSSTNTSTRAFASATVSYDFSANRGRIEWGDGSVTQGPGCAADAAVCRQCLPPLYEKGSADAGTGGCTFS